MIHWEGRLVAQQANFVQESVDRFRDTVASIENDFEKVQKRLRKQIRTRSKAIEKQRKSFERQTQKRVKKLRSEIRKNSYIRRAQGAMDDATKQVEQGVDNVLKTLNIASKRDVGRIDRKLGQINRKLREIEKAGKNDGAAKAS